MPYTITKNEKGEYCVYKKGADGRPEGDALGCHESKEDAQKQIAAIWANEAGRLREVVLERDFVARLCPKCAEAMDAVGVARIRLKDWRQMPAQLLEGLCAAVPAESFTECMAKDFGDFAPADKEGFCAWLHHECTGMWPGEESLDEPQGRQKAVDMARYDGLHYRQIIAIAQRAEETLPKAPIRFVASTEGVKRDGLDLKAQDWEVTRFMQNPIVSWAHDYNRPPIGRAAVSFEGRDMIAEVTFDDADPFAMEIERKVRQGFINAVSVGWSDLPNGKRDLVDIAVCAVPVDPQALAISRALDEPDGLRYGVVISRKNFNDLEQAHKLIGRVLARARHEPEEEDEEEDEDEKARQQTRAFERMLVTIKDKLDKIGEVGQ